MEDIAKMAGVSRATVSRVVNGIEQGVGPETRRRVLQIVKETDYRSYSLPSQNQPKALGLIIPDIMNSFFGELVKAVEGEVTEQGYTVLLGNTDFSIEKEERYLSIFLAKRVGGTILVATARTAGEHYQRLEKYSVPCVLVGRMLAGAEYTAGIFVDNSYALLMACSLLVRHRNEKIALISGPRNISTSVERVQGYRDALEQYQLPFKERFIKYDGYTFEDGYRAIMELERGGTRFTGVLAASDTMALSAIKALKELTYAIPEGVEITGFDNIGFSQLCDPPLTTIQQPTIEMGRRAADTLIRATAGKPIETKSIHLQPKLVVGGSVKAICGKRILYA